MSLDIWLTVPGEPAEPKSVILIRENGTIREISREEWDSRFPDREPVLMTVESWEGVREVFSGNITHNLSEMADKAGLYVPMWRPDELNIAKAGQLVNILYNGLLDLMNNPDYFKEFNPSNGWGTYEGLVEFVEKYLAACKAYPDADIHISR